MSRFDLRHSPKAMVLTGISCLAFGVLLVIVGIVNPSSNLTSTEATGLVVMGSMFIPLSIVIYLAARRKMAMG